MRVAPRAPLGGAGQGVVGLARRVVVGGAVAGVLVGDGVGCMGATPSTLSSVAGVPTTMAPGPSSAAVPSSSRASLAWPVPVVSSLQHVAGPFVSPGHGGAVQVRVVGSHALVYERSGEPGTQVCAEQVEVDGGGPAPLLCMRLGEAGWAYGVALPGARSWAREGVLDDCAACHAQGPRSGLFGPP